MKRDMDLVRGLLLKIETAKDASLRDLLPADATEEKIDEFAYHVGMLVDAGFLKGSVYRTLTSEHWHDVEMTWRGHELLEAIRDPEVWRQTKEGARRAGLGSVEFVWELAKSIGRQIAKEKLGMEI